MTASGGRMTLVGAGLSGALLAVSLARAGFDVEVFEKRPDPRQAGFIGGRSINLALSERGLRPLRELMLVDTVLSTAVKMRGRMVHDRQGRTELQPYGINEREVNWSVSRAQLNIDLLQAAEDAGARLHFGQKLVDAAFGRRVEVTLEDAAGDRRRHECSHVLGCDGAGSALRHAMDRHEPLGERVAALQHGYKELEIPPASDCDKAEFLSRFAIEPQALHIWPRGGYMCIALPNRDGSFTVTLFLPMAGESPSFAALKNIAAGRELFADAFGDVLPLLANFDDNLRHNPTSELATLYLERWHHGHQALLLGDAAHAIVPFHGQGMNAGFEDVDLITPMLRENRGDPGAVIEAFGGMRKADTDAIATMALENYIEMRDSVADPRYLLQHELATELARRCPAHVMPRYRMVTFTHLPYSQCLEHGRQQSALLDELLGERTSLDGFDFDAAAALARTRLAPLGGLDDAAASKPRRGSN